MMKKDGQKKKDLRMMTAYGAVGLIALAAIATGLMNRGTKRQRIDLNATPTPEITENRQKNPTDGKNQTAVQDGEGKNNASAVQGGETVLGQQDGKQNTTPSKVSENQGKTDETPQQAAVNDKKDTAKNDIPKDDTPKTEETEGLPVMNPDAVLAGLRFSKETGMLWPITGDARVSFSPDHVIYNKTLDSYRTTDYVLLSGAVGTPVYAAAEGIVTSVSEELWTGTTVTMRVSEDHEIVYGLLSDVAVREGDHVKEGTVFAKLAEPTRYFVEEGSGLYLKVLENETPVNPMLYLAE